MDFDSSVDEIILSQVADYIEAQLDVGNIEASLAEQPPFFNVIEWINEDAKAEPEEKRFGKSVTEDQLHELISDQENLNRKKSTAWGYKTYMEWREKCMMRGEEVPELTLFKEDDVNHYLCRFVVEVRKKNGGFYPPKTLYTLSTSILRFMRNHRVKNMKFLNDSDDRFLRFRKFLDAQMKKLTADGYGMHRKQAESLSEEQEQQLWDKNMFGDHSAQAMLHTVFFYNNKLFGLRSRNEHRNLDTAQVSVGEDDNGTFIHFVGKNNKTFNGGLKHRSMAPKDIKHYADKEDTRLTDIYLTYLGAVPSGPFYRRPVPTSDGECPSFNRIIGVNTLQNMMKEICAAGGLAGNFTNHSGKRTLATRLFQASVDEQLMKVGMVTHLGYRIMHGLECINFQDNARKEQWKIAGIKG